jgi:hypothetical protein
MPDKRTLTDRAKQLAELVEKSRKAKDLNKVADDLAHRLSDVRLVADEAAALSNSEKLLSSISDIKYSKRSLSPRLRSLEELREAYAQDPASIGQPNAFDREGYKKMLDEISDSLLKQWRKHTTLDSRTQTLSTALESDPSEAKTDKILKGAMSGLDELGQRLPSDTQDIEGIERLHKQISEICNEIEKKGYDEDIGRFLEKIGTTGGFSLKDLLGNKKILDWVNQGDHAKGIRVSRLQRRF